MARILVVGKYYPPFRGGIESYTGQIAEALALKHEVTAVVFNHRKGRADELEASGVRVVRARRIGILSGQPLSLDIFRALHPGWFDLVHFQSPNPLSALALLLRLPRKAPPKLIITHHMEIHQRGLLRLLASAVNRRLMKRAAAIIMTSAQNLDQAADIPKSAPIEVIPLGVNPADYQIDDALREEAGIWRREFAGEAPTVAFLGRHARYKGLQILVEALVHCPTVHALIAGDGPYRSEAEALARKLNVMERAHFLGEIAPREKLRLFAAADVFAMPSTETTEAFGISQVEAMAARVPVVASAIPTGVMDVARHEETALLCEPGSARSLAGAVQRLLGDDILRARLTANAFEQVQERFNSAVVRQSTVALFDRLAAQRAEPPPRRAMRRMEIAPHAS